MINENSSVHFWKMLRHDCYEKRGGSDESQRYDEGDGVELENDRSLRHFLSRGMRSGARNIFLSHLQACDGD